MNLDILDDELDIFEHEGVTENNISVGDKVVALVPKYNNPLLDR